MKVIHFAKLSDSVFYACNQLGNNSGGYVQSADAIDRITELEAAMQLFVDRCDKGEVRSTKTYNQFKTLLKK